MNSKVCLITLSLASLLIPGVAVAQQGVRTTDFTIGLELKGHYRDSEDRKFPSGVQAGDPSLPPEFAATGFPPGAELRTVDPGSHYELSVVTLFGNLVYRDYLKLGAKIDFIDIHDRNPTSEDKEVDVDDAQVVLGREVFENRLAEEGAANAYLRAGKFGKMERQDDRHLESYGLVSTAFNRFEDQGVEIGTDLTPNFYVKGSYTSGNPLFIRDPNALAGDNGTRDSLAGNPELNSGIVILYDAEVEDLDFTADAAEIGVAAGFRTGSKDERRVINLMGFAYERDLQDSVKLEGTLYGADLDVLDAPGPVTGEDGEISIRGTGRSKQERGANLWLYFDDTSLFAQVVAQEIGSLERFGWEVELAHFVKLPKLLAVGEKQILTDISPAVRYSSLDQKFAGPGIFPAVSVLWDWEKIDAGVRVGIYDGLDLTIEYAFNEFVRKGRTESMDEFLATCRWRMTF